MGRYLEYRNERAARILRGLRIAEVSAVDRGAGRGVKVMLMKRVEEDKAMPAIDIEKRASATWESAVSLIQKQQNCTRSRAVDVALANPAFREAFDLARDVHLFRMEKLGDGDWPGGTPHGSSSSDPEHPHSESQHDAADDETARLRSAHAALKVYHDAVEEVRHNNPTWTHGQCHDAVQARFPATWKLAKEAKGMLPPSHDGNSPPMRGPYEGTGGGRPYGRL
jgi:hypothetical protein